MSALLGFRLLRCFQQQLTCPLQTSCASTVRCFAAPPKTGLIEFLDLDSADLPTGRSWQVQELRLKSFEDLQKLWYVCYKEQNMLLSEQARKKLQGKRVVRWDRMKSVKQTMARIKHVLSDRAREKFAQAQALKTGSIKDSDITALQLTPAALQEASRKLHESALADLRRLNAK